MAANCDGEVEVKLEEGVGQTVSDGGAVVTRASSDDYKTRATCIVETSVSEKAHDELDKKKTILKEHEKSGTLDPRTVTDAVTGGGKSSNPYAADQLGLDILASFRRKVFGILLIQCAVIWGLAALIARIPFVLEREIMEYSKERREFYVDCVIVGAAWILAVIALAVVSRFRYRWSRSLFALSIFTVLISTALGLMCGPNVIYGLGLAMGGMILVALPTCVRFKDRMIEVLPVAMIVSFVLLGSGIAGWRTIAPEIEAMWVVPTLLLNCIGMVWLGYEMDWICSRLNPDEYLLPICLVWSEILTTTLIITLMVLAGDTSACQPGGCMSGTFIYCHCDCWLYANGDSSRKQYYRNMRKFEAQADSSAPPAQQTMQPPAAAASGAGEP